MAVSLAEVRQKYPQYSDIGDAELAAALHSKYYSDIPFEEFSSQIGLSTPTVSVTAPKPTQAEIEQFEKEEASYAEKAFGMGSPAYSFLRGAIIEPALGVNQLLAETGLFGERVRQGASQVVAQERAAAEQARKDVGREGFDWVSLGGAILSPVNRAFTAATAPSALMRVGQAAASGAIYGGIQPIVGDDPAASRLVQMGIGATLGGVLGGATETSPYISKFIRSLPITEKNKEAAFRKYIDELAPDDKKALVAELRKVGEIVEGSEPTVAEALSDMPSAYKILKAQERLERKTETAGKFLERRLTQQKARVNALEDVFGSPADLALAKEARLTSTAPMRERALAEANIYGETASKLEEQLAKGTTQFGALAPKQKNDIIKGQIENIKANGYYPLSSKSLLDKIDNVINAPGTRSNDVLTYAVSSLRGKLAKYTDERGVINSADLYNVRKEIALDIEKYLKDTNSFKGEATKVETQLKKLIDAEINKASGSNLWSDYLAKFTEHSRKIDQMELGQSLKSQLVGNYTEETAGKFLAAIKNAPSTVKRATGVSRYEKLEDVLTKEQMAVVNKTYADILRQEKAISTGKGIEGARPVDVEEGQIVPGFISAKVTAIKNVLRDLARGSQEEFDRRMADLLLDRKKFADFLEFVPEQNQDKLFQAMIRKMGPKTLQAFQETYQLKPTGQEVLRATTQEAIYD